MGKIVKRTSGEVELILNDGHHLLITILNNREVMLKVFEIGLFGFNKKDIQVWHLISNKPPEEYGKWGALLDRESLLTAISIATGSCATAKAFEDYMDRMIQDANWHGKRLL